MRKLNILAAAICLCAAACGSGKKSPRPEMELAVLNEVLTNEISDTSCLERMDRRIESYMNQWQLKGASLAVMRNDSLLYAKGYGWADEANSIRMEPYHLLRLASVSKLITATGIMVLQEQGKLSLRDSVFGERGILGGEPYCSSIKDRNYYKITVEDLLRHKGGFTCGAGDPMFSTRSIMVNNRLENAPDNDELIGIMLKRRLGYVPGTSEQYSNFGYLLLSKIIEKTSGMSYEDFTQKYVLRKAGCTDFHIAGNYYKDRHPNEVRYYVPSNEQPVQEFNNSGRLVTRCYGGNDITALSGAGAWIGSVPELAKFVASIDGRRGIENIIEDESILQMTEYFDEKTYSLGWNDTAPDKGWTRTGTFSGTSALIKYFPDGECWIFVTNTSTWKGPGFSRKTAALFSELRSSFSAKLPSRNLFYK